MSVFSYFFQQRVFSFLREFIIVKNKNKTSGQTSKVQGSVTFLVKFLPELSSDSDVTASPGMSWNMSGDTRGDGKMTTESVSMSGIPHKSARNSASHGKLFPREISIPLKKEQSLLKQELLFWLYNLVDDMREKRWASIYLEKQQWKSMIIDEETFY